MTCGPSTLRAVSTCPYARAWAMQLFSLLGSSLPKGTPTLAMPTCSPFEARYPYRVGIVLTAPQLSVCGMLLWSTNDHFDRSRPCLKGWPDFVRRAHRRCADGFHGPRLQRDGMAKHRVSHIGPRRADRRRSPVQLPPIGSVLGKVHRTRVQYWRSELEFQRRRSRSRRIGLSNSGIARIDQKRQDASLGEKLVEYLQFLRC